MKNNGPDNMATASYYNKGSDEYIDAKCSLCADKNKDQIADHYCYDCEKSLCKACLGTHSSMIKDHIIVQGNGNDTDGLTEKCGVHEDEIITLFCLQHKELMCIQCRRQDHRTCKDVKHIKETTRQLSTETELQAVKAQLQSELNKIQKSIETLDNDVESIQNRGSGFLEDLELYAEKLLSRIKEMREKGKCDIKSKQDQLIFNTKRYRQEYVLAKDEISRCLDAINKPNQLKATLFILKNKAKTITKKVYYLHNESDSWIEERQFNFMADMKIMNSLKSPHSLVIDVIAKTTDTSSVNAVGGVVDSQIQAAKGRHGNSRGGRPKKKQESSPVETSFNKRVEETVRRPGEKPAGGKAHLRNTQVNNIDVCIPDDKKGCVIYGCCSLSDGCLVIADKQNSRLKLVDPSSGTVIKSCDTNDEPWAICCIGPQEVAVTFPGFPQVQVYNTKSLARTRTVELGHKTTRIACHGGLLYCAGWLVNILYVHDVRSGKKLREISKDTNGRELFSGIRHIAVNSSGDRVYVTDGTGLVCVGVDDGRIFRLSPKDLGLTGGTGVTTDHYGHVYVCGLDSHNVVKVTEDGHVVGQILSEKDGITWDPFCLSYDVSRSRLYVGGRSDQLLMVEWK